MSYSVTTAWDIYDFLSLYMVWFYFCLPNDYLLRQIILTNIKSVVVSCVPKPTDKALQHKLFDQMRNIRIDLSRHILKNVPLRFKIISICNPLVQFIIYNVTFEQANNTFPLQVILTHTTSECINCPVHFSLLNAFPWEYNLFRSIKRLYSLHKCIKPFQRTAIYGRNLWKISLSLKFRQNAKVYSTHFSWLSEWRLYSWSI